MAPEPNAEASPATVGAWQVVAHWSTLFVLPAVRAIFCIRKFSSFVQRHELRNAIPSGPCSSRISASRLPA